MKVLEIINTSKKIKKRTIINNINMYVNEGEIVGFLGPNGAGKTTAIKLIAGLLKLNSGDIKINGHSIITEQEKALSYLGAIVENPDLYKDITGRQNLEYFAKFYNDEASKYIDSVVELVKMKNRIDHKVKTYSLGMRQRVGLATALLHMPKLLILDEPTNGLDPLGIKELRELLKQIATKSNAGILVSSHILSEMELMCDRIYIIDNGVIVDEKLMSSIKEINNNYNLSTKDDEAAIKYLNNKQIDCKIMNDIINFKYNSDITQFIKELLNNNIEIVEIYKDKSNLENEFLDITNGTKNQII